jgi:hypothetical protein
MTLRPGEIVLIRIDFQQTPGGKLRPAAVLLDSGDDDFVAAPVTSHFRASDFDVPIHQWREAGLNRGEKPPRGVGSEPGDRQDWQRISGKMRRKSMPVLSVPGALVGGDEVSMAVFHELSRAEGPSQQGRKTTAGSGLRTRGQTGLAANFRQNAPEIHASLVSPGGARGWR